MLLDELFGICGGRRQNLQCIGEHGHSLLAKLVTWDRFAELLPAKLDRMHQASYGTSMLQLSSRGVRTAHAAECREAQTHGEWAGDLRPTWRPPTYVTVLQAGPRIPRYAYGSSVSRTVDDARNHRRRLRIEFEGLTRSLQVVGSVAADCFRSRQRQYLRAGRGSGCAIENARRPYSESDIWSRA